MKLKKITFLIIVVLALMSCNSKEKKAEAEYQIKKETKEKEIEKLKVKYSAIELTKTDLVSRYSFELEEQVIRKTLIGYGNILDIEKNHKK